MHAKQQGDASIRKVEVANLETPIKLVLQVKQRFPPANRTDMQLVCVAWDEKLLVWSDAGVLGGEVAVVLSHNLNNKLKYDSS